MDDDTLNGLYRSAYGHAANKLERAEFGTNAPGRDPAKLLKRLLEHALRETGDRGPAARRAIEEGVADATAGRKPRW